MHIFYDSKLVYAYVKIQKSFWYNVYFILTNMMGVKHKVSQMFSYMWKESLTAHYFVFLGRNYYLILSNTVSLGWTSISIQRDYLSKKCKYDLNGNFNVHVQSQPNIHFSLNNTTFQLSYHLKNPRVVVIMICYIIDKKLIIFRPRLQHFSLSYATYAEYIVLILYSRVKTEYYKLGEFETLT